MEVCKTAEQKLEEAVQAISNPQQDQLIISEPCLMQTCAWYVGQLCAEYDKNMGWMFMPYDRLTDYAKDKEQAQMWLDAMQDF